MNTTIEKELHKIGLYLQEIRNELRLTNKRREELKNMLNSMYGKKEGEEDE